MKRRVFLGAAGAVASEARRLIEGSGVPVRFFPMWLRRKAGLEAG